MGENQKATILEQHVDCLEKNNFQEAGRAHTGLWSVEEQMEGVKVWETLVDDYLGKLSHEGVGEMGLQRDRWPGEMWGFVSFCL